jgi:hypothetical protein
MRDHEIIMLQTVHLLITEGTMSQDICKMTTVIILKGEFYAILLAN